jgi:hypothetical protein
LGSPEKVDNFCYLLSASHFQLFTFNFLLSTSYF